MMKKTFTIVCTSMLLLTACASKTNADNQNATHVEPDGTVLTANNYVISEGIPCEVEASNAAFYYVVIGNASESYVDTVEQATNYVKNWWNNDETFNLPEEIFNVSIAQASNSTQIPPRGFQDSGYVFVDFSNDDALETLVHELIHFEVSTDTLLYPDDGSGREIMEMVVEAITVECMGSDFNSQPTNNYIFFKSCPMLYEKLPVLEANFKANKSGDKAYSFWGSSAKSICDILQNYYALPPEFETYEEYNSFIENVLGVTDSELTQIYAEMY